ncbi:MAG TPA: hypothetical protein VFD36_21310 [Kofleriaceae bacterium]|jgi:hypothetical protein|nr:hypothetical protein [Kofleriaceae bacterium]
MSTAALVALAVGSGGIASADLSKTVISAFKGELVITKGELPEGKTEKDTIAKIKAERLKELTGEARGDVTYWRFHYTAFLSKPGATQLKMEFWTNDKDKKFVADNRLDGVDPKITVLSGDISINEDDGLLKSRPYLIKLVTEKDVVVASTPMMMK